jgi:TolA-binding protein
MPADLRAQRFERVGDFRLAQGNFREADEAYRSAAKEYYYEYELGGFGFFELKKHALSQDLSAEASTKPEDQHFDVECLKGYLELAGGRTCEGIARLECLVVALKQLSPESEMRRVRLPDAHFLLAVAWLEEGAVEFGTAHGHAAIRTAAREPEQRASLFAFAQMLAARSSEEQAGAVRVTAKSRQAPQTALSQATAAVQQGRYVEARAKYKSILDSLKEHDARTVLEACNGIFHCFIKENQGEGFEAALARFRDWTARSLPEGYEGCTTLAMARACYQHNDLQGAAERIKACLTGGDSYVVMQAQMLDGLIQFRSGRMTEALASFEEVLPHAAPDDATGAEALFFVGYINMVNGDGERAQKMFQTLVERYPKSDYAAKCRDLLDRLKAGGTGTGSAMKTAKEP